MAATVRVCSAGSLVGGALFVSTDTSGRTACRFGADRPSAFVQGSRRFTGTGTAWFRRARVSREDHKGNLVSAFIAAPAVLYRWRGA